MTLTEMRSIAGVLRRSAPLAVAAAIALAAPAEGSAAAHRPVRHAAPAAHARHAARRPARKRALSAAARKRALSAAARKRRAAKVSHPAHAAVKSTKRPAPATTATAKPAAPVSTATAPARMATTAPAAPAPAKAVPATSAPASRPVSSVTAPLSAPVTTAAPLPAGERSAWDAPVLTNPVTIVLSDSNRNLTLSQSQDYILACPAGQLSLTYALSVWGGHNVELENCDFNITTADWAAHLKNQTGTLYVRNVHFGGAQLTGGIQLQEPGATTVVMRDVLFDMMHGSYSTNHAECLQTWSGPQRLLIDGLTCPTQYQGLFMLPNQWDSTTVETVWDLRNISIDDTAGAYALWLGDVDGSTPSQAALGFTTWNVSNVYVDPNPSRTWSGWWLWPKPSSGDTTWSTGVTAGVPAGGPFVTAVPGGATGVDATTDPAPLAGEQS